jgi:hypothetical protein
MMKTFFTTVKCRPRAATDGVRSQFSMQQSMTKISFPVTYLFSLIYKQTDDGKDHYALRTRGALRMNDKIIDH